MTDQPGSRRKPRSRGKGPDHAESDVATIDLRVTVAATRGDVSLDIDLHVAAGEVVAIVGPNGAGKSTLLHLIAGLLRPDAGSIELDGRPLVDTARHVDVAPEHRKVGVVFQDYLLFESMSVLDNVAFADRSAGMSRQAATASATEWVQSLGLAEVATRRPRELSGGQRQRVALARALASGPDCLLLDEPLAALDAESRAGARRTLRSHLAAFAGPVIMVTHEPLEALALADRIVVLENGTITQEGSPSDVARRPRSEWVARLVGLNLFHGRLDNTVVRLADGGELRVPAQPEATGAEPTVLAAIHPRAVSLHRERPTGSPRNVWEGTIGHVEFAGDRVRIEVEATPAIVAEVTAAAVADLDLAGGGQVWVSFKASEITVYPE